jgi:hypothetical protein
MEGSSAANRVVPLVTDCKGGLSSCTEAAKSKFPEQRTFVDLFEESGAQSVRDLKDGGQNLLGKRITESALIGVVPKVRWPTWPLWGDAGIAKPESSASYAEF